MIPSSDTTRAAQAVLTALALASFLGCAHQQIPRAAPPLATTQVPPAAGASQLPATPPAAPAPPGAPVSASPAPAAAASPPAGSTPPARAATSSPAHAGATARPAPATAAAPAGSGSRLAPAPAAATAPAALNLASLEQRLRDTHAIGVFTKLSLKNQVDDLLAQFHDFYAGQGGLTLAQLRRSYELLLMKVVTLLQDNDPGLASAVASSREAIWAILSNRTSFNNL